MSAVGFSTTSFSRMSASFDLHKDLFLDANNGIQKAVYDGNFSDFHDIFVFLNALSENVFNRYIKEGSYYPALTSAMRKGDFQKVLNTLDVLNNYPRFQTPTIRLCQAACLHQLGKKEECLAVFTKCREDFNVHDLLDDLIRSKRDFEKRAFQELYDDVSTPESP